MFKWTYTKRDKRKARLLASGVGCLQIGTGGAGDGPGLRIEWTDDAGRCWNAVVDDDHTLQGLADQIAAVRRMRAERQVVKS